jgi:hypothetical protein
MSNCCVIYAERHKIGLYSECHSAECLYAECRGAAENRYHFDPIS